MLEGERRLAAIMFTDLVGFTALGQKNESLALSVLADQRNLLRPIFKKYGGREVKTIGDGFLVDFPSALNAVNCAYDIQKTAHQTNNSLPEERRVHLRIGIHLGDVLQSDGDITGDAVNVASRIEALAEDGGVCLTRQVYDHVQNKFELPLKSLGPKSLKNLRGPVEVFKVMMPWEESMGRENDELDRHRVAVLPLRNMSPDPNDEYFADGMTEELITALSGVRGLTVIARTSIMQYKNSPKRVADVGKELKTGTVIEGSVRKAANKVRITVQMIDAQSEGHLWAQNYDRQMDDVFAIQSEIAEKVADALKVRLVEGEKERLEKRPTENSEAYTLMLKGRYYWNERTKPSVEKGIAYLEKALQADPNLAQAYSDLANAYVVMADYSMMRPSDALVKIQGNATKALEIDVGLSQPHAALAVVHERNFRWAEADKEFRLAIELNPNNATARHWHALNLFFRGRSQEAIGQWRKAIEIDPLSLIIGSAFGYGLVRTGETEEGLKMQRAVIELNDTFIVAHRNLAPAYIVAKMNSEAVDEARKLLSLSREGANLAFAASTLAIAGERDEALDLLEVLKKQYARQYTDPAAIAIVYASLGNESEALDWLEKAVNEKSTAVPYTNVFPWFDSLKDNVRFRSLIERAGLR